MDGKYLRKQQQLLKASQDSYTLSTVPYKAINNHWSLFPWHRAGLSEGEREEEVNLTGG